MACREHLARLRGQQGDLDRYRATVVVVTFERHRTFRLPAAVGQFSRSEGLSYPILSDPGRRLYAAFGLRRKSVIRLLTPSIVATYLRGLGSGRWPRLPRGDLGQLGGDFVLDAHGLVVFAHRGRDAADRPPIEAIVAAVRAAAPDKLDQQESG